MRIFPLKHLSINNISIDANIIIDFYCINKIDLLKNYLSGKSAFIASSILFKELNGYDLHKLELIKLELTKQEEYEFVSKIKADKKGLSALDAEAICIAYFKKCICLSNDLTVRKVCEANNINVAGSLTILKTNVNLGDITPKEAIIFCKELKNTGTFFSENLIKQFIKEMG
jgi:predicted nucleic acid-binding protein